MPLGANAVIRAGGTPAAWGLIIQHARRELRGKTVPLTDEEPISGDAERCVMVKSAPTSSFIVAQSQFLLEFLVIALNNPAMFGHPHQRP